MDGGFPAQAAYNAVSVQRIPTHGAIKAGKLASSYYLLIDHIFATGTLFRFANIASSSMVNHFIWYLLFIFLPHEWHNVWYLCCLNVSVVAPVNMAEICAILIWQGVPQGAELNQFTPAHHRPLYVRHKLAKSLVTEKMSGHRPPAIHQSTGYENITGMSWACAEIISTANPLHVTSFRQLRLSKPQFLNQTYNRLEILHRARQYHCRVCPNFQNDLTNEITNLNQRDFARSEFKLSFVSTSYTTLPQN